MPSKMRRIIRVALDRKHVKPETPIAGAREIAFFPPMTGDSPEVRGLVRVQAADFDPQAEAGALTAGRRDVGALVTFVGLCRDEGGRLAALELEHYPGMAEAEIGRVVAEAERRWPLLGVTAIHRSRADRAGRADRDGRGRRRPSRPPSRRRIS
jgi:hypothetical protein